MLEFKVNRLPSLSALFGKGAKGRFDDYVKVAKNLESQYHRHWLYFFYDIFACRFLYGADLKDDYLYFKMYALKSIERKRYVTYGKFVKQTEWFFTDHANEYVDSKSGFLEHYKEFCKRDFLILPHADDADAHAFFERNPVVFVKSEFSNCAQGVHKYKSQDILADSQLLTKVLSTKGAVEAGVVQCKEMAELNPDCVNTIRITTMIEGGGNIRIFSAALRVGGKGADVDNQHAGGCAFHVDVETGIVLSAGKDLMGNYVVFSPTGRIVPGFQIPRWEEVKRDVVKAAKVCPEARFVGWDVAIGEDGPIFIEANNSCGETLYQFDGPQWDYFLQQR